MDHLLKTKQWPLVKFQKYLDYSHIMLALYLKMSLIIWTRLFLHYITIKLESFGNWNKLLSEKGAESFQRWCVKAVIGEKCSVSYLLALQLSPFNKVVL